jgi:ribosome-associated translation inhibitor RaiA
VYKAEINVTVGKNIYRVESIESDLYMAIDMMKDRVAQEIAKSKDKKTSLFKRGGFKMKEALKKLTR